MAHTVYHHPDTDVRTLLQLPFRPVRHVLRDPVRILQKDAHRPKREGVLHHQAALHAVLADLYYLRARDPQPGSQGGHPINLAGELRGKLLQLVARSLGPAWVGINRLSGKSAVPVADHPVYADKDGKPPNMALLAPTNRTLGGFWTTTRTCPPVQPQPLLHGRQPGSLCLVPAASPY